MTAHAWRETGWAFPLGEWQGPRMVVERCHKHLKGYAGGFTDVPGIVLGDTMYLYHQRIVRKEMAPTEAMIEGERARLAVLRFDKRWPKEPSIDLWPTTV
jgi:hypothetical protein